MSKYPSIARLVAINAVVGGLEIAACVAFTFIPPLLLKSGFSETHMSIILGVAPFMALFSVPMLGKWSDSCTSRYGRRRPFIFFFSLVLVFSLFLLFVGQSITVDIGTKTIRMLLLSVGVILLDYASQAAINPCEALMSDLMAGQQGEEAGFTVYSGMLSVGACIGYLLTALDWNSLGFSAGNREQTALVIVLVLYVGCFLITMLSAHERPFRALSLDDRDIDIHTKLLNAETTSDPGYESDESEILNRSPLWPRIKGNRAILSLRRCSPMKILTAPPKIILNALCLPLNFCRTISTAPPVLRDLFWADLASWIAIMAHGMFYTDFVATAVYGGQPDAPPGSVYDLLFDEGVRMGSWGLLLHSITACVYAVFIQEHVTKLIGLKRSYQLGLGIFALSMAVTVLNTSSLSCLNLAAATSGLGYAVITTIPNALVTMYHEDPLLYFGTDAGKAGVGADIAILDSGYYLSQIGLSLVMGRLVEMTGLPHYYIIVACISGLGAILAANKVVFSPQDLK